MRLRHGTSEAPLRLAVLASGSGSGMGALVRYQQAKESLHTTVVVVTDKANAGAIERATALGCAVEVVPLPDVEDRVARRSAHEDLIQAKLEAYDVEAIVLSGWMRLLTAAFVERWKAVWSTSTRRCSLTFLARMPPRRPRGRSIRKWMHGSLCGCGDGHWTDHRPSGRPCA